LTGNIGGNFVTSYPNNLLKAYHTVAIKGSFNFPSSLSGTGKITMVSPIRIRTSDRWPSLYKEWNRPGHVRQTFGFVPEPSRLLLLAAGAAGLAVIGRRRIGK